MSPRRPGRGQQVIKRVEANDRGQLGNLLRLPHLRGSGPLDGILVGRVGGLAFSPCASGVACLVILGDCRPVPSRRVSSTVKESSQRMYPDK